MQIEYGHNYHYLKDKVIADKLKIPPILET